MNLPFLRKLIQKYFFNRGVSSFSYSLCYISSGSSQKASTATSQRRQRLATLPPSLNETPQAA